MGKETSGLTEVAPPSLFDRPADEPEELLPDQGSALLYRCALSVNDSDEVLATLLNTTPWQQHDVHVYGRSVAQPRLVAWFGNAGRRYTYAGLTLEPLQWNSTLSGLKARCEVLAGTRFNSALANLYRNGRDHVAWHADDEPEFGLDPTIASVSLGAERRFDFRNKGSGETIKTMFPHGSVVVMSAGCQRHWLHQAPKMLRVKEPRINITFRTIVG